MYISKRNQNYLNSDIFNIDFFFLNLNTCKHEKLYYLFTYKSSLARCYTCRKRMKNCETAYIVASYLMVLLVVFIIYFFDFSLLLQSSIIDELFFIILLLVGLEEEEEVEVVAEVENMACIESGRNRDSSS
jgi:hypothetical protein